MTALPPSLDRFQTQLEAAIARDLHVRRRRPLVLRLAAVGAAAAIAVIAVGAANLVTGRGPSIVERAAAALESSGGILHVRLEQTIGDGEVLLSESWQSTSTPFRTRHVDLAKGSHTEVELDGGTMRVYDRVTNTIYEGSFPRSKRIPLKDFRGGVLDLLESGEARFDGHEVVDGRDAIRIVSRDGTATYLVDATTYDPIEWRKGALGVGATIRFLLYEELPATPENVALVSVAAQHPTAQLTHDAPPVVKRSRTHVIAPSGSTAPRR